MILGWCIFQPTHIRNTPFLTYATSSDLQARGFTALQLPVID